MRAREGFTGDEWKIFFASRSDFERPICFLYMQENAASWSGKYLRFVLKKRLKNCCNRENYPNHRFTRGRIGRMAISYANALAEQIDFSGLVATRRGSYESLALR
jgi:hypothetical protein